MVSWSCYPDGTTPDLWTAWHQQQNPSVRAKHAVAMRFLTAGHWKVPHYKPLQGGNYTGLGEIIISAGVEWRLLGRRDIATDAYLVLIICNHKGRVYTPKNALKTAAARWKEVQQGLERIDLLVHPA